MKRGLAFLMAISLFMGAATACDSVKADTVESSIAASDVSSTASTGEESETTVVTDVPTLESTLIGEWIHGDEVYAFGEDGKGVYFDGSSSMMFVWYDTGDTVSISFDDTGDIKEYQYHFDETGLVLTADSSDPVTYTKN